MWLQKCFVTLHLPARFEFMYISIHYTFMHIYVYIRIHCDLPPPLFDRFCCVYWFFWESCFRKESRVGLCWQAPFCCAKYGYIVVRKAHKIIINLKMTPQGRLTFWLPFPRLPPSKNWNLSFYPRGRQKYPDGKQVTHMLYGSHARESRTPYCMWGKSKRETVTGNVFIDAVFCKPNCFSATKRGAVSADSYSCQKKSGTFVNFLFYFYFCSVFPVDLRSFWGEHMGVAGDASVDERRQLCDISFCGNTYFVYTGGRGWSPNVTTCGRQSDGVRKDR